ncbi:MAG: MerR family DNA-binding transcriptional regulator [Caulobacter sp.]|nr:MerR family DNA-binding transcriptional regulator [Caulobacter sp.]
MCPLETVVIEQTLAAKAFAKRFGVSVKALRLYEAHGLITPDRTLAGWRAYGPGEARRLAGHSRPEATGRAAGPDGRTSDRQGKPRRLAGVAGTTAGNASPGGGSRLAGGSHCQGRLGRRRRPVD